MRMYDLIMKKRNGKALSEKEISFIVRDYTAGRILDYQMSALLMAIFFQGLNEKETTALTLAMAKSGDMLDLSSIRGKKVDKHSTGGVGDKTTIALTPMVAACGLKVAKMSGRGLGHTGGTIDKLESIPGFSTALTEERFFWNVNDIGLAVMGQTAELAPADKKLYALRDVTATVDNISLIASSIMSKKLAAGADAIVLDVKTGSGAFMKDEADARRLAETMTDIGKRAGRDTVAVVSDMNEPLGYAVGNALEVKEAIATLQGRGPEDFTRFCLTLGSLMLVMGELARDEKEGEALLLEAVRSGRAFEKFVQFVDAQDGDTRAVREPERLPQAREVVPLASPRAGYLRSVVCDEIGICATLLGGGRERKDDAIDPAVGIVLRKKLGEHVEENEPLAMLHVNDKARLAEVKERFLNACEIGEAPPVKHALIHEIIR